MFCFEVFDSRDLLYLKPSKLFRIPESSDKSQAPVLHNPSYLTLPCTEVYTVGCVVELPHRLA